MRRRGKLLVLSLCSLLLSHSAAAGEEICVLRGLNFEIYDEVLQGFWKGLGRSPSKCNEVLKGKEAQVEKKFSTEQPKLIMALGNSALSFTRKNYPKTSLVFGMATDIPNDSSLTGVLMDVPLGEQLRVAKSALANLKRIGVIYSVNNRSLADQFRSAAEAQGLTVDAHAVNNPSEAVGVVSNFQGSDLLWILPDQGVMTNQNRDALFRAAKDANLKVYAFSPLYLKGATSADLSVSLDWKEHGEQIGEITKQILANPNAKPRVEKPEKVKLYLKEGRSGFQTGLSNYEMIP